MVVILLISVLECTLYIKNKNERKQKLLEITMKNLNNKEEKIKLHKEKLEKYKELTQQIEAQETKIKELEILKDDLLEEFNNNKESLEILENQ